MNNNKPIEFINTSMPDEIKSYIKLIEYCNKKISENLGIPSDRIGQEKPPSTNFKNISKKT
jgi:hypothetical protein